MTEMLHRADDTASDAAIEPTPSAGDDRVVAMPALPVAKAAAVAPRLRLSIPAAVVLVIGALAVSVPTMMMVGRESWSTEQGAHGPLVLLTGAWLFLRAWKTAGPIAPPPIARVLLAMLPVLALFIVARISQIVEIEGYVMYLALLTGMYAIVGGAVMRRLAFPILYLAFAFPPPDTLVYALTLPMKILITKAAVGSLALLGYPIGYTGVWIQVAQYQLLVAAACSGLNSIISLSVLSTFYIYVRHAGDTRRAIALALFIIPVAMAANFVRVLILILLTYHAGEATAQGFLHNFAGITMFAAALLILFAIDSGIGPMLRRMPKRDGAPVDGGMTR